MIAVFTYDRMPGVLGHEAWAVYRSAMEPTKAAAAQRHMLTSAEFDALDWNERITKIVAFDERHQVTGLAMMTHHLDAYDWIEPAYFELRYPEAYKRDAIHYVLFVVAATDAPRETFAHLVREIVKPIRATGGVGALDWSQARVDRGLASAARLIIGRDAPLAREDVDAQYFHTYIFDWPDGKPLTS